MCIAISFLRKRIDLRPEKCLSEAGTAHYLDPVISPPERSWMDCWLSVVKTSSTIWKVKMHIRYTNWFIRRRTCSKGNGDLYQIDLADLSNLSSYNDGYIYLLNCINVINETGEDYIDLANITLLIPAKIIQMDGINAANADPVAPVNITVFSRK